MTYYAMSDGRAFTTYEPACQFEAKFARAINASNNMEYRAKLSSAGSMCALNKIMASPVPGDGNDYATATNKCSN